MEYKRPTKEFTTTGGHKIVHKSYVSGGEAEEIQLVYFGDSDIENDGTSADVKFKHIKAKSYIEANKKRIELLVVSVDDSTDNVVERVRDLDKVDYDEVVNALTDLNGKKNSEIKNPQ